MAHFAKLDENNIVTQVTVITNDTVDNLPFPESEPIGISFLTDLFGEGIKWVQTSYNANFRRNFAGVGYSYDASLDAFIPPQPYPSWIFNPNTCQWDPPVPYPNDGKVYYWDEATLSWVLMEPR